MKITLIRLVRYKGKGAFTRSLSHLRQDLELPFVPTVQLTLRLPPDGDDFFIEEAIFDVETQSLRVYQEYMIDRDVSEDEAWGEVERMKASGWTETYREASFVSKRYKEKNLDNALS